MLDQTLASLVHIGNQARRAAGAAALDAQDLLFERASIHIENVRFALDRPGNILGSVATKHGEIAEIAEVGVRSAWDTLNGVPMSATMEGVGRTAAADYVLNGVEVQSKFLNGVNNTLGAVKEHMAKYPEFGDGKGIWAMPRDQYETVMRVLAGEPSGLGPKAEAAIRRSIESIEQATGRDFSEAVQAASFDYKEVQLGAIDDTLDERQSSLSEANDRRRDTIREEHEPSLAGGLQAAAAGAAVGAGVTFVRSCFTKYREEGKNVFKGEFTAEDWKEVGLDVGEAAAIGGVSAGAIYNLTNYSQLSAPLAGAMVAAVKGLAPLVDGYARGELSQDEFVDLGLLVCSEVGMVAGAAALGQVVIPIPAVGALVGSIAGQVLSGIVSGQIHGSSAAIEKRITVLQTNLSATERSQLADLEARYAALGDLTIAAFDTRVNASILMASVSLAREYGVPDSKLLLSVQAVDAFMLA